MKYKGDYTKEISFPIGGIGTGSMGLGGNGRLIDWEIFNRPHKQSILGFSHFAIKAENEKEVLDVKILNSDYNLSYMGYTKPYDTLGYGYGVDFHSMAAIPHFKDSEFIGEYPFATINFKDKTFPGKVSMTGFNPLIPQNSKDSSIPCACFTFKVKNNTKENLTYSIVGMLENPAWNGLKHTYSKEGDLSTITMYPQEKEKNQTIKNGNISLSAIGDNVTYQQYAFRGAWFDTINVYWDDLHKLGGLKNREYDTVCEGRDHCVLSSSILIEPGKEKEFKFIISWYYPVFYKYWGANVTPDNPDFSWEMLPHDADFEKLGVAKWNNYYAKLFSGSDNVAEYIYKNWDRLYNDTKLYKDTLFASTVPSYVLDAVSSTLSVLRSPTCYRLENGEFYGFEGSGITHGDCEGTCEHVWNYAYAMPFLFPDLERSIRDLEYKYAFKDGKMGFRMLLPLGIGVANFRACLDGQMGSVIKTYREWKISGDDEWLKSIWDKVKASLEYAWAENNPDKWDRDKDGILEGRQHHTLDMELYGPSSWLQSMYVLALKAASEMAKHLGESEKAKEYFELYEKGKKYLNNELFNGEYFIQNVDVTNEDFYKYYNEEDQKNIINTYWDTEHKQIKYQMAEGSSVDQALGQWHSNNIGLGSIFEDDKLKVACESLYKYNYLTSMRDHFNSNRIFAINDEAGTIICAYPKHINKPVIPIVYSDETMNGFEYSCAILLIQNGLVAKGLEMLKSVRDRYNGKNRNPWNEFECGNNYARSMASFSALNTLSGFEFDMTRGYIGFNPIGLDLEELENSNEDLELIELLTPYKSYFWSVGNAWGNVEIDYENAVGRINILYGEIELKEINICGTHKVFDEKEKFSSGVFLEFDLDE